MNKMGCVYRRKNSKNYWIKYSRNGKAFCESSASKLKSVAEQLLKRREGEIAQGKPPGIIFDRVAFNELTEDFLADYRVNNRKSLERAEVSVLKLKDFFGGMKVSQITTATVKLYSDRRLKEGLSNATINRELAALKRMFQLAYRCTPPKVNQIPYIPMLKEPSPRRGFFEHEEFVTLREVLPDYLKPVVTFAYHTGWRKAEILKLKWDQVDLKEGLVRLHPGQTKNDEARSVFLNDELQTMFKALHSQRIIGCPYVFKRDGKRIKDFRSVWVTACKEIGACLWDPEKERMVPTKIFHDFRRTAVRNMIRAGIHERVAMMISGHKTRSIFDRYNIVSEDDLREAAIKQQNYLQLHFSYSLPTFCASKKTRKKGQNANVLKLFGGSAWESNPPGTVLAPRTGFEVQEAHQ